MAYRNINVDGKDYQYTVGRQYTNVKGVKLFRNDLIGQDKGDNKVAVTPFHVALAIRTALDTPQ